MNSMIRSSSDPLLSSLYSHVSQSSEQAVATPTAISNDLQQVTTAAQRLLTGPVQTEEDVDQDVVTPRRDAEGDVLPVGSPILVGGFPIRRMNAMLITSHRTKEREVVSGDLEHKAQTVDAVYRRSGSLGEDFTL